MISSKGSVAEVLQVCRQNTRSISKLKGKLKLDWPSAFGLGVFLTLLGKANQTSAVFKSVVSTYFPGNLLSGL